MSISKFQRIAQIDNSFRCKKCPIRIKKGVILYDRQRELQLLNLVVTNCGNVTVDEIEVKIVSYDCYGNPIPEENGKIGQICRFTDGGCLPDQSIGEGEVILLPSDEVVNCDVMVTRVKTAGNIELTFTEEDYEMAPTKRRWVTKAEAKEKNRKLKMALTIALGVTGGIYLVLILTSVIVGSLILPKSNENKLQSYLDNHDYRLAIRQLDKIEGGEDRKEDIISEAIAYYKECGEYAQALKYAQMSDNAKLYEKTLLSIVKKVQKEQGYEEAVEFAKKYQSASVLNQAYADVVAYYAAQRDFRQALTWVALSGNADLSGQIYRQAVEYYVAEDDYVTAMEYALKTRETDVIKSVYAPAVTYLMNQGDYNLAALYIARANFPDDDVITAKVKAEAYEKADLNYKRSNAYYFLSAMTLAQKQTLYATTLSARTEAVLLSKYGTVSCTDRNLTFSQDNVTSVAMGDSHAAALLSDGTVVTVGNNVYRQCETSLWQQVMGIACGEYHTVGLLQDGTVVATGSNDYGQCNVNTWTDIVQVVCGPSYTVGLKSDGTVVATGRNNAGQCNVAQWNRIIYLAAGGEHLLGLKNDGTVVAAGAKASARCNVGDWKNVVNIAAGVDYSIAVFADGSVTMTGSDQLNLSKLSFKNITHIAAGDTDIVGISAGSVVSAGLGMLNFSRLKP